MALQTKTVKTGNYTEQSWSNGYVLSLKLTEESVDFAANTSVVSYLLTISNTNSNHFSQNNVSWHITICGQNIAINNFNFNLTANYTTQTIVSGQVTVSHNADGTLEMPYNVYIPNLKSANPNGPPAMALAGSFTLTTIPRPSTVYCPAGVIGKVVTVVVKKISSGISHTVTYQFGDLQGTVAEKSQEGNINWIIPKSFYTQIPNAKRGQGMLICKTYSGNTLVGSSTCVLIADIDEDDCWPGISAQITDINPNTTVLTGNSSKFVRYYSTANVVATYSVRNSATIASYAISNNGKTYKTDALEIQNMEDGTFDFSLKDSRGFTRNLSVSRIVVPYVKLTCNVANTRPDVDGNMTLSVYGNFFANTFGAVSNTLTVQYRYKRSGSSWQDWQTLEHSITENTYTGETYLTGLDYRKSYSFQARAIDKLATVNSATYTARATPVFDWGEEDFQFHVPVHGITPEMVGIKYETNDGTLILKTLGVEAGLLFVRDGGNLDNYYLGAFNGYKSGKTPRLHMLSANVLDVTANSKGTVSATGLTGEATYAIIPFITI